MLAVLDWWRGAPAVWDVRTGRLLRALDPPEEGPHDGYRPKRLSFSPDGELLVLADDMGHLLLYATATGRLLRRWRGHDGAVLALLFSVDGRTLFTGSRDSIRVVVGRNPFGAYDRVAGEGRHLMVRLVDSTVVIDAR